ncbi:MAG TPA: MFS transporter [Vicinamibacterales bacterium]|jgi:MFS family permease|nr:MFS transporter [Vicinamibacterales bacterium]
MTSLSRWGAASALRHRNFRLLWIAFLVSFTGSNMQSAAILWHVSLLVSPDRKGLALGAVGLVRVVPIVIFSMIGGVMADAWHRQRLMLMTQTLLAIVALVLAAMTARGVVNLGALYGLTALGAMIGSFDLPARQALVPNLVPRDDLPNALSLNTAMMQAASITGPAAGGILIGTLGLTWVYALNALSFLFVIAALLMMRGLPEDIPGVDREAMSWQSAVEGLRFVFSSPLLRSTTLLDFFATFFSSAVALLPIFAQDILQVGPQGYGWLYAAPAAGAVIMSIAMIALTDRIRSRGPVLLWAVVIYGAATVGFGLSRSFWITFACLALTGVADTVSMVIRSIVSQLETPDRLRGRMTGVRMVFFMGGPQLGELEAGAVAQWLGAPFSVISGGLGCMVATAWVAATTPELRHYRAETQRQSATTGTTITTSTTKL